VVEESPSEKYRCEVELKRLEVERYKADKVYEGFSLLVEAFKEYYLRTGKMMVLSAWIAITIIFVLSAYLTYLGKVSGETFSFIAGTIVGYIISLLGGRE